MSWLIILLIYLLNMRCEKDHFKVQKIFFLKNDLWHIDQNQFKTDQRYLCRVNISLEGKSVFSDSFNCFIRTCYSLKSTNLGYIVLEKPMIKEINSFLSSPEVDTFFLRLHFIFTDKPIYSLHYFEEYEGRTQVSATSWSPEKLSENSIKLICDVSTDSRIKNMKKILKELMCMKILSFNEFIKSIKEKRIRQQRPENDVDFILYYFRNYSECLGNLKKFIENLCYLRLLEDNSFNEVSIGKAIILKVSELKEHLYQRCNEKFKDLYGNGIYENWKPLLDECFNYFKDNMLSNRFFSPIGGKYTIDYYIEQLYNLVFEIMEEIRKKHVIFYFANKITIFSEMDFLLKNGVKKLQLSAIQDFCDSEYVFKHFSDLLIKTLETTNQNIEVEKMVCDYYNMFAYINNLYYEFNKNSSVSYSYFPPISIDNYNLQIVDGIEINWPNKFKKLKGFNDKGEEIIMVKDTDYFIGGFGILYCPSDALKKKNIHKIEVFSFGFERDYRKFKVDEYLTI